MVMIRKCNNYFDSANEREKTITSLWRRHHTSRQSKTMLVRVSPHFLYWHKLDQRVDEWICTKNCFGRPHFDRQSFDACELTRARVCFINHSRFATHCFLWPVCYRLVCVWVPTTVDSVSIWRTWAPRARLTLAKILIYICCTTADSDFRSMMLLHRRRLWKSGEKKKSRKKEFVSSHVHVAAC